MGVRALDISANYFEANCAPGVNPHPFVLRPKIPRAGVEPIVVNSDIVLSGEGFGLFGSGAPSRGVSIRSGYHSPYNNGSAVLLIAAQGVVLDGNANGPSNPNPTTPLIYSGPAGNGLARGERKQVPI